MSGCTHVCLISKQPMPNLIPLLHEKPERAFFLISDEMKEEGDRLAGILQPRGMKIETYRIAPYDFGGVAKICDGLIADTPGPIVLNVTGGTKISALATFQSFYFAKDTPRIIYLHTAEDSLLQLAPEVSTKKIANLISVKDYLASYGLSMTNKGALPVNASKRIVYLKELCNLLVRNESLQGRLNGVLSQYGGSHIEYANIPINSLGEMAEELIACLEKCGVAAQAGSGLLNIPSPDKLFFCHGGWLEEYVYQTVRQLQVKGLKPLINVEVSWDGSGHKPTTNEFDVLFTNRNRLHVISCKTSKLDKQASRSAKGKEALYELDSLSDAAGGLFGRAMLCSAMRLGPHSRKRAEMLNIKVADSVDLLNLPEILRKWCSK